MTVPYPLSHVTESGYDFEPITDYNVALQVLIDYPPGFRLFSDELKNMEHIAVRAVRKDPAMYEYVGEDLKDNTEVLQALRLSVQDIIENDITSPYC